MIDRLHMSSLRFSISVKNLYTITDWLGSDPENAVNSYSNQGDSNIFPMPRTVSLGVNMGF